MYQGWIQGGGFGGSILAPPSKLMIFITIIVLQVPIVIEVDQVATDGLFTIYSVTLCGG